MEGSEKNVAVVVDSYLDIIPKENQPINVIPRGDYVLIKGVSTKFSVISLAGTKLDNLNVPFNYFEVIAVGKDVRDELVGTKVIINSDLFTSNRINSCKIPTALNPYSIISFSEKLRRLPRSEYNKLLEVLPTIDIVEYFLINSYDIIAIHE